MNKWIAEIGPEKALDLLRETTENIKAEPANLFFTIWIAEVDKLISNDGLGENHSELPDWNWEEAYSVSDLTPAEAVSAYLVDQTNSLLESFTAFSE